MRLTKSHRTGLEGASGLGFTVQRRDPVESRYDLMLELGGTTRSWMLSKAPLLGSGQELPATQTDEPSQSDTPSEVWDKGTYEPMHKLGLREGERRLVEEYTRGHMSIVFCGKKLRGRFTLFKMDDPDWTLARSPDE